ncbi:MAG TPA: hypothetical protein VL359_04700 [bacterium]|nr:hypothetical protein [bacterium]
MRWVRPILAWLAAFVVLIAAGFVWRFVLFHGLYVATMAKVMSLEAVVRTSVTVEVIRAALLASIYPVGYKGGAPWLEGLRYGLVMGLFSAAIASFYLSGLSDSSLWLGADVLFLMVQGGLAGVAIGLVYGRRKAA